MSDETAVPTGPVPQRIGDAERDTAVSDLREHHVAGRLDRDEFDTRMTAALAARTRDDLAPLFLDLPDLTPPVVAAPASLSPSAGPVGPPAGQRYAVPVLASAIWPLTILACVLFQNWALIAVPIIFSMMVGGGCGVSRAAQLQRARVPHRR